MKDPLDVRRQASLALILGAVLLSNCGAPASESPEPLKTNPAARASWNYSTTSDEMRGTSTRWAELNSSNAPHLDFPYAGGSPVVLQLFKGGGDIETNIRLLLANGQFACSGSAGRTCSLTIKVDDEKPQEIRGIEDECGSHTCLRLGADLFNQEHPPAVLALIQSADNLVIEVPLYDFGPYQYKFATSELRWEKEAERVGLGS
jgi:hypothetical protein